MMMHPHGRKEYNMNITIFDTETTSLDKPFCYNIGYVIVNDKGETLIEREFIVEQVWHNLPLFESAYYANKRPLYVQAMRARAVKMDKFGYICAQMRRDFKNFEVSAAYAFNSAFDEKVFAYNCDWFKCLNPFDEIPIYDIRGYVHNSLISDKYKQFCENNSRFSDTGNYSTTAETVYQYITGLHDFEEAHTALNDAQIETTILFACIKAGASLGVDYKAKRSIPRAIERTLHVRTAEQTDYYFDYSKIRINKERTEIVLK